jgi:hypothetical protein
MQIKKHTAIRLSLCGVVVAVCIIGSSLLVRRGQAHSTDLYCAATQATLHISEHQDKPVESLHIVAESHNDDGRITTRQKVKMKLPPAILSYDFVQQCNYPIVSSLNKIVSHSDIIRPAYYAFLFRYTLF